jgi:hypothetical protein
MPHQTRLGTSRIESARQHRTCRLGANTPARPAKKRTAPSSRRADLPTTESLRSHSRSGRPVARGRGRAASASTRLYRVSVDANSMAGFPPDLEQPLVKPPSHERRSSDGTRLNMAQSEVAVFPPLPVPASFCCNVRRSRRSSLCSDTLGRVSRNTLRCFPISANSTRPSAAKQPLEGGLMLDKLAFLWNNSRQVWALRPPTAFQARRETLPECLR